MRIQYLGGCLEDFYLFVVGMLVTRGLCFLIFYNCRFLLDIPLWDRPRRNPRYTVYGLFFESIGSHWEPLLLCDNSRHGKEALHSCLLSEKIMAFILLAGGDVGGYVNFTAKVVVI